MTGRGLALVAVVIVGCATVTPARMTAWQHEQSALKLGCTWMDVTVAQTGDDGPWLASCAGRNYICHSRITYVGASYQRAEVECDETEESKAAVYRKVVTDRLSLETACPRIEVAIVQEADWSRGGEKAYRMTACGKPYVCTTAAGRTDCKAALAQ